MYVKREDASVIDAPDPIDKHVGERIWRRRREVGLSRRALGEVVGIGLKQVNKYETAVNRVSAGRLHGIAAALGVAPSYFFEGLDDEITGDSGDGVTTHSSGSQREVRTLVDAYHRLPPDVRSRFLRLVRVIADSG